MRLSVYQVNGRLNFPVRLPNPFQRLTLPPSLLYYSQGQPRGEFGPLALPRTQHDTATGFSTELCWDQMSLRSRGMRTSGRASCQGGSLLLPQYSHHHTPTIGRARSPGLGRTDSDPQESEYLLGGALPRTALLTSASLAFGLSRPLS